jgi:pimeloyl-ACP methyl ester carboxylesterase
MLLMLVTREGGDQSMNTPTALTLPTRFVETDGIRFAYRRWGKPDGLPLVFLNYFTGNLDDWDPRVTDGFAADSDVVASSGGETPNTVSEMARDALAFCDALGIKKFNAVGFSVSPQTAEAQLRAIREWGRVPSGNRYATLESIKQPTLIVHGNKDIVVLPGAPAECSTDRVPRFESWCSISTC